MSGTTSASNELLLGSSESGSERWQASLIPPTAALGQVIANLEKTGLQIALVVSPNGTLLGTVTDGDIRRGLLRGLDLDSAIDSIIHREPLVVPPQMGREAVLQLMHANKIRQLPVVNDERRTVGLHVWDELILPGERQNLMLIMAGGQGTRMRPHTETCPKAMLPVAGKPMLEYIIERAKAEGFKRFAIAVHYLGHMIEEHFGDGSRWGVQIEYVREKTPLGTAGAIALLNPRPEAAFLVSNGDVLTDIRYGELLDFHIRHAAAATMAVALHEWKNPFGVVYTDGVDIVGFEEKPVARSHINAGIYALDAAALNELSAGEHCDMPTLFTRLQEKRARIIAYPMHEPWLDVGGPDQYDQANGTGRHG